MNKADRDQQRWLGMSDAAKAYLSRMDRVVRITHRKEAEADKEFWRSRSPQERLEAIEFLRGQYMAYTHAEQRLQRVCRIVERARR